VTGVQTCALPIYLLRLTELEVAARSTNALKARIKAASFPVHKDFDTYDFTAQPTLNKPKVLELARGDWIDQHFNSCLIGSPGTGKTHVATALGLAACRQGRRVRFFTAATLVTRLEEAQKQYQLDRFLMLIELGYPSAETESRVLATRPATNALASLTPVLHSEDVLRLQNETDAVTIAEPITDYIVSLARATREHPEIRLGLSPRGALGLAAAARATAILDGRDYCTPEDVIANIRPVVAHRLMLKHQPNSHTNEALGAVLDELTQSVPSPA